MTIRLTYFFYFFFFGLYFNLIPGHFQELGLSGPQRGLFFAIIPMVSFFANIFWGKVADIYGIRLKLLSIFAFTGSFFLILTFIKDTYFFYILLAFVFGLILFPIIPLTDSVTISYCNRNKEHYGFFRQWGTISFILANIITGLIFYFFKNKGITEKHIMFLMPVAVFCIIFSSYGKKDPVESGDVFNVTGLSGINIKIFIIFLIVIFLHNLAFVGNYSYFSAHLKILGINEVFISLCWAISPVGEIFLFRYGDRILNYFNCITLLRIGLISGALRWLLFAFLKNPVLIAVTQILHTFTFGAYYLASVVFLSKAVPERMRSTGQGIFSAVVCLAMVFGNIIMGRIFETGGTYLIFLVSFYFSLFSIMISLGLNEKLSCTSG